MWAGSPVRWKESSDSFSWTILEVWAWPIPGRAAWVIFILTIYCCSGHQRLSAKTNTGIHFFFFVFQKYISKSEIWEVVSSALSWWFRFQLGPFQMRVICHSSDFQVLWPKTLEWSLNPFTLQIQTIGESYWLYPQNMSRMGQILITSTAVTQ